MFLRREILAHTLRPGRHSAKAAPPAKQVEEVAQCHICNREYSTGAEFPQKPKMIPHGIAGNGVDG